MADPKALSRRSFLGTTALLGLAGTGCGYLLYPERRGRRGGYIDGPILIVDLIWLLPGLIPGIICLAVDFSTGCIYASGGGRVDAQGPSQPVQVSVEVAGKVVARGDVQQDGRAHLVWSETPDAEALRAHGKVFATSGFDALAQARVSELI